MGVIALGCVALSAMKYGCVRRSECMGVTLK